ncbi:chitin synthase (CHS1) [Vairimorpha necatrix]|uniref:chitin synthase n=1 Tax=Vairimorpha necatrix TaxID=6039 RepID=A0AAX4JE21_9MICR
MLSQGEILRNPSRTRFQKKTKKKRDSGGMWPFITCICTFLIPNFVLSCFGMKTEEVRNAWREKVALCVCIALCCCTLTFLTYGMTTIVCKGGNQYVFGKLKNAKLKNAVITNGSIYLTKDSSYSLDKIYTGTFKNKSEACSSAFGRQLLSGRRSMDKLNRIAPICFDYSYIVKNNFIVIDNKVYDTNLCKESTYKEFIKKYAGGEAKQDYLTTEEFQCFKDTFFSGEVAGKTRGCYIADAFLYITTVIIFSLIFAKFVLATVYSWHMRRKVKSSPCVTPSIMLVTCYSEDEEGIRNTIDSLCKQDYDYENKLIMVISDGEITGSNNIKSTPELILGLMETEGSSPQPKNYVSLMPGSKRVNRAIVYSGYYKTRSLDLDFGAKEPSKCRMIFIRKCGNEFETFKAGNRGKRDSQVLLMSFFSKLIYNDRLSELDFELYNKMKALMPHIDPKDFECILMVDADTVVKPDALTKMINIFETDPKVIGICGETMISNKCESWVSMIQVFEYYISHHLTKTFESVFGGVTCLPGCFCMYRIKIITDEEGNVVTGHRSNTRRIFNEDRKLIFVPQAKCETYVPGEFKILLSQRRRWINSTIHNLFELAIVDKLCGVFCCSMQFVVIVELFGTLVLPAAIVFTVVLIVSSIINEPAWIPLIMLGGIFLLPAVLILITTFQISYIFWLLIYIISIPIWNFVLPMYAFWHFDDFSWGDTRKIDGAENNEEEVENEQQKIILKELEDLKGSK